MVKMVEVETKKDWITDSLGEYFTLGRVRKTETGG